VDSISSEIANRNEQQMGGGFLEWISRWKGAVCLPGLSHNDSLTERKFNLVCNFRRQILAGLRLMHEIRDPYVHLANANHKILIILFIARLKSPNTKLILSSIYFSGLLNIFASAQIKNKQVSKQNQTFNAFWSQTNAVQIL